MEITICTGVSVAAHGSGVGGDDTKDAVYTDINGRNGGDTAVLLGRVNGSITLSPEAKITGGGGLIYGLDKLIEQKTGIPVMIAEDAVSCVAMGTGKALNHIELLETGNTIKIKKF